MDYLNYNKKIVINISRKKKEDQDNYYLPVWETLLSLLITGKTNLLNGNKGITILL